MRIFLGILTAVWLFYTLVGYYGWFAGEVSIDFSYVMMNLIGGPLFFLTCAFDFQRMGKQDE